MTLLHDLKKPMQVLQCEVLASSLSREGWNKYVATSLLKVVTVLQRTHHMCTIWCCMECRGHAQIMLYTHTHTSTINICTTTWDLTSSTAAGGLCQLLTESFCKQLTETSGSKRPALTSPVRKAAVLLVKSHVDSRNAAMSLYQINIRTHTHTHTHVHTA